MRGPEHFSRRVELALFATGRNAERRRTKEMLDAHEQGRLDELYDELAYDDDAVAKGIAAGKLVDDPRLRDLLEHCPDPLTEPEEFSDFDPVPPGGNHEADLTELAQDAMQASWRAQAIAELRAERERERAERLRARSERRAKRLRRKRNRLEQKLAATRGTGWWRLGQTLARVPGLRRLMPPRERR